MCTQDFYRPPTFNVTVTNLFLSQYSSSDLRINKISSSVKQRVKSQISKPVHYINKTYLYTKRHLFARNSSGIGMIDDETHINR
jgi:hypothetical protein